MNDPSYDWPPSRTCLTYLAPSIQTLNEAISIFGKESQIDLTQEECAEMIAALSRFKRRRVGAEENVIEEIADGLIMLNQMALVFGTAKVKRVIDNKMLRLEHLIRATKAAHEAKEKQKNEPCTD